MSAPPIMSRSAPPIREIVETVLKLLVQEHKYVFTDELTKEIADGRGTEARKRGIRVQRRADRRH